MFLFAGVYQWPSEKREGSLKRFIKRPQTDHMTYSNHNREDDRTRWTYSLLTSVVTSLTFLLFGSKFSLVVGRVRSRRIFGEGVGTPWMIGWYCGMVGEVGVSIATTLCIRKRIFSTFFRPNVSARLFSSV